ncbi:hypothetical protein GYMLUDRAFT_59297 [Collybiopsis luxurians FD-317 M1]|uniref:F-box domain-containing protein n=1 Tax=Collybiopsis luxurians FD-317 M1 TaxID=944289 RepID=A0A0D0CXG7_9AGAR|nr:hypothetical protein GYMLUDRAFT_59297 [Collybiopsis luxurians FD-317 M1]
MPPTATATLIRTTRTASSLPYRSVWIKNFLFDQRSNNRVQPSQEGDSSQGQDLFSTLPSEIHLEFARHLTNELKSLHALSILKRCCLDVANSQLYHTINHLQALKTIALLQSSRSALVKLNPRHPASFIRVLKFAVHAESDSDVATFSVRLFKAAMSNMILFSVLPNHLLLTSLTIDTIGITFVDIFQGVPRDKLRLRELRLKAHYNASDVSECGDILASLLCISLHTLQLELRAVSRSGSFLDSGIDYPKFLKFVDRLAPNVSKFILSLYCTYPESLDVLNATLGNGSFSALNDLQIVLSLPIWGVSPQLNLVKFLHRHPHLQRINLSYTSHSSLHYFQPAIMVNQSSLSGLNHFGGRIQDYRALQSYAPVQLQSLTVQFPVGYMGTNDAFPDVLKHTGKTLKTLRLIEDWKTRASIHDIADTWDKLGSSGLHYSTVTGHCRNLEEFELYLPWHAIQSNPGLISNMVNDLLALSQLHMHIFDPLNQDLTTPGCRARLKLDHLDTELQLSSCGLQTQRTVMLQISIYGIGVIQDGQKFLLAMLQDEYLYSIMPVALAQDN